MAEEDAFCVLKVKADGSELAQRSGRANEITTTKYTLLTWLPVSFLYQFRRVANVYFLIISILMIIGTYFPHVFISPLEPLSTILTLIIVMLVTSLKEGSDDLARYRSDREENETFVTTVIYSGDTKQWEESVVHSKVVQPGDIVKLSGKCRIPVDMVLLMTSTYADGNSCYVETSNIDGETNLKVKSAPPSAFEIIAEFAGAEANITAPPPELFDISKLEFEEANNSIYTFVGAAKFVKSSDDISSPLGADNLLLRSSVFSNTDWAYGVAVYTGQETKVQMNNSLPPAKMSNFEKMANMAVGGVFVAQTIMVMVAVIAFYANSYDAVQEKFPYAYPDGETDGALPFWLEKIIVFYILFNNFIPISLYVTMELTNLGQADMIRYDIEMYDEEIDKACVVKSGNLMQELGQISQIFSDKTGTLTRNEMKLMQTVVDGATVDMVMGERALPSRLSSGTGREKFYSFLECLLLCHTVVREKVEEGEELTEKDLKKSYRAESPDELALILGTLPFGCDFKDRQASKISIIVDGKPARYELMATNAFNADRKRMSVVVREEASDRYYLMCKGADNIMLPLTTAWDQPEAKAQVLRNLEEMASKGLRTLVIGRKELSKSEATSFISHWKGASNSMKDRESELATVAQEVEQGMELVGITAIEDRLQDQVPEVIADLATAGITLWMLTGDKEETAVNIAASCNLTLADTKLHFLNKIETPSDYSAALARIYKAIFPINELQYAHQKGLFCGRSEGNKEKPFTAAMCASQCAPLFEHADIRCNRGLVAVVMDGPSYRHMDTKDEAAKFHLLAITKWCRSVVACRLTPSQKAQIVNFVKTESSPKILTLAIGDGANDVPMIQEADVGIGIYGKEGHQAANNSDFAIGQFKFLRHLMLVHGRACYVGLAKVCLYCLHKNMVITFTIFWYSFHAALSGTSPYETWVYTSFNFLLALPIIFLGILDRDITRDFCLKNPQTYSTSRTNSLLTPQNMFAWFVNGLLYAFLLGAFNYIAFYSTYTDQFIFDMGTTVFTALVLALQFKILAMTNQWAWPQTIAMVVSLGSMFLAFYVCSYLTVDYWEKVAVMYAGGIYWFLGVFAAPIFTSVLVDGLWFVVQYGWAPTEEMLMREIELADIYSKDNGVNVCAAARNLTRRGSMLQAEGGDERGGFDAVAQRESKVSEPPAAHPSATTSSVSQVLEADAAESLIFTVGSKDSNSGKE